MRKVTIDEVDNAISPAAVIRRLSEPLATEHVALNLFELEPGDSSAYAYHAHEHQEEVFVVLEGIATFDTDEGTVIAKEGEVVRFGPGEYQRCWNRGDGRVVTLVIGAPPEYGDEPRLRTCPTCEATRDNELEIREQEGVPGGRAIVAICTTCGSETGRWFEGSMQGEVP